MIPPLTLDFEQVFNASPNPYMLLDRELCYVAVNDAYLAVTERQRDDLMGHCIFDAFPGNPDDPDDINVRLLRASFQRVLDRGRRDELAVIPYTIPRRHGDEVVHEERYWSATNTPLFDSDGQVAFILQHTVDVTELLRTRRALHVAESALAQQAEEGILQRTRAVQQANQVLDAEHARLRHLFDQAPGLIAVLRGPEHVFELANHAYDRLVGGRSLVGRPAREALPEVVAQGFIQLLDQVYTSGQAFVGRGVAVSLQRKADAPLEERYLDFIYQPIVEADGSTSGIFVEGHDVTEQVEAQEQLRALNATLEARVAERTEALERRNQELQDFAYVASHDLQEPLRKIQSFADLLASQESLQHDPEVLHFARRMQAAAARMSRLIKDLLAFSRIAARGLPFETVDLDAVLEGVLGDLELRLRETQGRVEATPLGTVTADRVQMHQVLLNLVGNALKFHHPGTPPVVQIRREDTDRSVVLTVSDNGIGIDAKYFDRVFSPFQRLHGIGQYEGTGMGLAIVRRIAERHGGTAEVTHSPDGGTRFTITLAQGLESRNAEVGARQP